MRAILIVAAAVAVTFSIGCAQSDDSAADDGPRLSIEVAALSLDGITNADYTLTVTNEGGQQVWTASIDADEYGDGQGSVSFVGPCDADSDPNDDGDAVNQVELVLDALYDASGEVPTTSYVDPTPLTRPVTCEANADTEAVFNIAIVREASQGFFDVAVTFDDLFCSAKADCEYEGGAPIELLFNDGERNQTLVAALACTGGPGSDTHLYWDHAEITCDGTSYDLLAAAAGGAEGNQGPLTDLVFQHAYYFGSESLGTFDKLFFNIAVGLDEAALGSGGNTNCTFVAAATASSGPLDGGVSPASTAWPVLTWTVPLNTNNATLLCTQHPLDGSNGMATAYTNGGQQFRWEVDNDGGTVSVTDVAPAAAAPPSYGASIEGVIDLIYIEELGASERIDLYYRREADTEPAQVRLLLTDAGGTPFAYSLGTLSRPATGDFFTSFQDCATNATIDGRDDESYFVTAVEASDYTANGCAGSTPLFAPVELSVSQDSADLPPLNINSVVIDDGDPNPLDVNYVRTGSQAASNPGTFGLGLRDADGNVTGVGAGVAQDGVSGTITILHDACAARSTPVAGEIAALFLFDASSGNDCATATTAAPLYEVGIVIKP